MTKVLPIAAALLAYAPASYALQPLEVFLNGANKVNPDVLESQANVAQTDAQKDLAWARVLPGISGRLAYTSNQHVSTLDFSLIEGLPPGTAVVTVIPKYQWDGSGTLTVPLINFSNFWLIDSAKSSLSSAQKALSNTRLLVQSAVTQDFYQVVANMAFVTSAQKALDVSKESLRLATVRRDAGVGPELDVDRARADVETQTQQVATARLQVALAARSLESSSSVTPDVNAPLDFAQFVDPLQDAPPLETVEKLVETLPSVESAKFNTQAADQAVTAQKLTLLPSILGTFTEHGTNAPGFATTDFSWQMVIALTWQLDFGNRANINQSIAAADAARAREQRARLNAGDVIHRQWATIRAGIVRSRSARAGQEAAQHAAQQAHDRYEAGTITQLDLLTAQRDAFSADVTRIQADADLVNARAQLRLAAGASLLESSTGAQAQ
jgi:outer membrane protein TolC